jgi:hypothetical protein
MKKKLALISMLSLLAVASRADSGYSFVNWTTQVGNVWQGNAGGVDVTLAFSNYGLLYNDFDLTGPDYAAYPGSSAEQWFAYPGNSTWTLTLSAPTEVILYTYYWRGIGYDVSPNTGIYQFDNSFSIASGLSEATIAGNDLQLGANWGSGIVAFNGPLTSLTGNSFEPIPISGEQGLAFAVVSTPEPASAMMIGLGGALIVLFRRFHGRA